MCLRYVWRKCLRVVTFLFFFFSFFFLRSFVRTASDFADTGSRARNGLFVHLELNLYYYWKFSYGCRIDPFPMKKVLSKYSVSFIQRAIFIILLI